MNIDKQSNRMPWKLLTPHFVLSLRSRYLRSYCLPRRDIISTMDPDRPRGHSKPCTSIPNGRTSKDLVNVPKVVIENPAEDSSGFSSSVVKVLSMQRFYTKSVRRSRESWLQKYAYHRQVRSQYFNGRRNGKFYAGFQSLISKSVRKSTGRFAVSNKHTLTTERVQFDF